MSVKNVVSKIKSVKNIEIIIAVILCLIILCVYISSATVSTVADSEDFEQYIMALEAKLYEVVCAIDGVAGATVAISYDSTAMFEYVYDTLTSTNGEDTSTSSEIVLVDGQPILIRQIVPSIVGVVVVLHGTTNAVTDMYVLQAVTTLLDIDSSKVEII